MNAPIDVIAELKDLRDVVDEDPDGERAVNRIIDAVAELIEAAKEREAAHRDVVENIPPGEECGVPAHIRTRYRVACQRFDAALARVGGVS